jgi:hypothetical protein
MACQFLVSHLWNITNLEHLVDQADMTELAAGCECLACQVDPEIQSFLSQDEVDQCFHGK